MTKCLEAFKESAAWSAVHEAPLAPGLNNPHIYGAYALKILRANGISGEENFALRKSFKAFADACRIRSGLFNRWPGGRGGLMSHDELLGLSYIDEDVAREIVLYLVTTDGIYANVRVDAPDLANVYRIAWVRPALTACAGFGLSLITQLIFGIGLLFDALTWRSGDQGGRLRTWLAIERFRGAWLAGFFIEFWIRKMESKGLSPKKCFEEYLTEYPIYHEWAPDTFRVENAEGTT